MPSPSFYPQHVHIFPPFPHLPCPLRSFKPKLLFHQKMLSNPPFAFSFTPIQPSALFLLTDHIPSIALVQWKLLYLCAFGNAPSSAVFSRTLVRTQETHSDTWKFSLSLGQGWILEWTSYLSSPSRLFLRSSPSCGLCSRAPSATSKSQTWIFGW